MILTGNKIYQETLSGSIIIEPFNKEQVNPNSYNYRLGDSLKVFIGSKNNRPIFKIVKIPENGYVLKPNTLYLANTLERIGSQRYAMSLIGRSSIGRLGLFLQVSANLGHTHSNHRWTLELVTCKKIRIYKNMVIGQVSFWNNYGKIPQYDGFFGFINDIQESNL